MSKDLADLDPKIRTMAETAFQKMNESSILCGLGVAAVGISETKRSLAVQMAYYSRSRMKNIEDVKKMYRAAGLYYPSDAECNIANTWTLQSKHIDGLAVDFVPIRNGSYWWSAPLTVWEEMGKIGKECGLKWGGDWKNKDCPHFEI